MTRDACGDLSLASALNFFLNYQKRAAGTGGTPDQQIMSAKFSRSIEYMGVVYARRFEDMCIKEPEAELEKPVKKVRTT